MLLQEPEEQEAPEPELGGAVVDHIITAGNAVDEAYRSRPKSYELTGENAAQFATIEASVHKAFWGAWRRDCAAVRQ